jgi:tetratricopeptide (TPR) repeat protein
MTSGDPEGTHSIISGGSQYGPVLQGRDFRDVHIETTVVQATAVPVALDQLPPLEGGFTGRDDELAQLAGLLDSAGDGSAVVVSAVAGLAGVGKTALALQAADAARQAGWFPGGVLFLNLHGYDESPVQPGQALEALLRALGMPGEHIPPGDEERAGLYRSVLAQVPGAVLVIADNASAEAQVRPLLPGPGRHRVLVTSRHTLGGLGARLLDVTELDQDGGVLLVEAALRAARPDDTRIQDDRTAATRVVELCGGLPLALRITAALLAADTTLGVAELADELDDEVRRLEALRYDDGGGTSAPSVAAAFELSYRQLHPDAARLFRLLAVNPGPDVSTGAAAALANGAVRETRRVIGQLVRAHLVEVAPGSGGRWRMHDLVRVYARQLSDANVEADGREQAQDRLFSHYLDRADAAADHLRTLPGEPVPTQFTGRQDALDWLDAERANLIAAVTLAASIGHNQIALRLPLRLGTYLLWRRRFDDLLTVLEISRTAAHNQGDRLSEGVALDSLGLTLQEARRFDEAISAHQDAAAIFREIGDRHREGQVLNHLGVALREMGRFDEAITAHQDALAIFRETGDRHREGQALNNLEEDRLAKEI